jgi:hypothetical protein
MATYEIAFIRIPKVKPQCHRFKWSGEVGVSTPEHRVFYGLDFGGGDAFDRAQAARVPIVEHIGAYFVDIDWLIATAAKANHAAYFTSIKSAALAKYASMTGEQVKLPPLPRMTVAEELANRNNCRVGLAGIRVELDGVPDVVASSYWAPSDKLIVRLESGVEVAPERLILRSNWPPACCSPGRWHALNRHESGSRRARKTTNHT